MNEDVKKKLEQKLKEDMLQTCRNIITADVSRFYKWETDSVTIMPSDTLSKEELSAVKEVTFKQIDYNGKNPRTVKEMHIELHDKLTAMNLMCKLLQES